jgi:hypothetical protein
MNDISIEKFCQILKIDISGECKALAFVYSTIPSNTFSVDAVQKYDVYLQEIYQY